MASRRQLVGVGEEEALGSLLRPGRQPEGFRLLERRLEVLLGNLGALDELVDLGAQALTVPHPELRPDPRLAGIDEQAEGVDGLHLGEHLVAPGLHRGGTLLRPGRLVPRLRRLDHLGVDQDAADLVQRRAARYGDRHRGLAWTLVVGDLTEGIQEGRRPVPDEEATEGQDGGSQQYGQAALALVDDLLGRALLDLRVQHRCHASVSLLSSPSEAPGQAAGKARPEAILTPRAAYPRHVQRPGRAPRSRRAAAESITARCCLARRPASPQLPRGASRW